MSHALSAAQVDNLIDAASHAKLIGLPLNRMITIHWQAAGLPLEAMPRATGQFVDLLSKTVTRHGSRTAWLWVHENGDHKGAHCHLLAHVPRSAARTITRRQRGWLKRITGKPYRRGVIRSRPIGLRLGLEISNPELYELNLQTVLFYCLKGADVAAIQKLRLARHVYGGRIIGKRCATSQNIGPKARKGARS